MQTWVSKALNLPILQDKRMQWVDYLKGIAIVLVVYRHVLIGIERSGIAIPGFLVDANMVFYSFRMPLFFILAGLFISGSLKRRTVGEVAFIKFENILYPYLVWAFLQVTLQILLAGYTNSDRGLVDYTYIFYQPRNLDQFWYLPALFNTIIIYILLKYKLKIPVGFQLLLGIALYFLSSFMWGISMISDWMEFYIFFALGDAISELFFKKSTQDYFKKNWLFFLVIPLFAAAQWYYLQQPEIYYLDTMPGKIEFLVIALIGCFSMFVLAFKLQELGIMNFLRLLGYHSLYIYVMHVFAAALTRIAMMKLLGLTDPYVLLFLGIISGVLLPILFYNLLVKNNFLWFLFSFSRNKHKHRPQKIPVTQTTAS